MPLSTGTSPIQLALLVLLLPLASATLIAIALRRLGNIAALVSTLTAAAIAAGALALAFGGTRITGPEASIEWLRLGGFSLSLGFKFDDLAALMLSVVGIVGLCVHVFSLGYMSDDSAKARYFGGLSIFMFSMIGIVLADNLFMIFIFWELVGFSSWLLINHFCDKTSAADAAKKAFIANRVGDFGFLLGIIACYAIFGTVNLSQLAILANGGVAVATCIPLLLFCGAVGKSAQMPLHVWLPDAMEGPTPVSALIHAATMVAAGIYMLCRIEPLFAAAPDALTIVMWVGTATALYAALCAVTQRDIKKVLAYSTLSQLGYMVAAFGLGRLAQPEAPAEQTLLLAGVGAAMFHLTTHAFFKALMFLGSGSVIHGCHHEQDIFKMGGLAKKMPVTFITFTIGVLAIGGLPFISGFYSKDAILHLAQAKSQPVFVILVATAVLTAFYMARMWKLVFLGTPRTHASEHAHESGLSMTIPLLVLAALSIVGGWTTGKLGSLLYGSHFNGVWSQIPHAHGSSVLIMSIAILLVGAGTALVFYKNAPTDTLEKKSPPLFTLLAALKVSFDAAYDYYVAKIQQRFALLLNGAEMLLLSGLIIRGAAGVTGLFGLAARALHTGSLHAYVYWFLIGAALFWALAGGLL
ncbi:NADH-quinone oxidoreductase subunit L [Opitutaceae bacterium TAV4]|nr:NADH-quinone oxidoreductase subunit L [Opitutaceae bacterium TAV4]RRJ98513.1 NADH-quinone oxidoreductase subunit L [Opitutaceae bacterium TAV3]